MAFVDPYCFIVMGVTCSGKSTLGKILAVELDIPFYDADEFHPEQNIAKMSSGLPLNDEDRKPWLNKLQELILHNKPTGMVLACSALKSAYRETLETHDQVRFVYLNATRELIAERIAKRQNHFMPASLLESQFATLEQPSNAISVDASKNAKLLVGEIISTLSGN